MMILVTTSANHHAIMIIKHCLVCQQWFTWWTSITLILISSCPLWRITDLQLSSFIHSIIFTELIGIPFVEFTFANQVLSVHGLQCILYFLRLLLLIVSSGRQIWLAQRPISPVSALGLFIVCITELVSACSRQAYFPKYYCCCVTECRFKSFSGENVTLNLKSLVYL